MWRSALRSRRWLVSLSTTPESELMSCTEVSQTSRFAQVFLKELFDIQIAAVVFKDNVEHIFFIKNHKAERPCVGLVIELSQSQEEIKHESSVRQRSIAATNTNSMPTKTPI